jgi:UDP-glucose 4-epimerase
MINIKQIAINSFMMMYEFKLTLQSIIKVTINDKINKMLFSIGATRYTDFGKTHFLQENDKSVVVLYPTEKYSDEEILSVVKNKDFSHSDISLLYQEIVIDVE